MRIDNHRIEIRDTLICSSFFFFFYFASAMIIFFLLFASLHFMFRILFLVQTIRAPNVHHVSGSVCIVTVSANRENYAAFCVQLLNFTHMLCMYLPNDTLNFQLITTIFHIEDHLHFFLTTTRHKSNNEIDQRNKGQKCKSLC